MNRILKRPMFRMGGSSGTGITSGLDRQNYANGTDIKAKTQELFDIRKAIQEANEIQRSAAVPGSLPSFLTSFGLNLLAQPGGKNIFQTAAKAAQQPFSQFQQARLLEQEKGRGRRDAAIDAALAGAIDIKREEIGADKDYAKKQELGLLDSIYQGRISKVQEELDKVTPGAEGEGERKRLEAEIKKLQKQQQEEARSILTGQTTTDEFIRDVVLASIQAGEISIEEAAAKYPELQEIVDLQNRQEQKDGGRINYQMGGITERLSEEVRETTEDTGEVQDLTYTELRARLPQSIDNTVVQLLANSKQALLEFANIRDQQDVDQFNQSYGVNLTIPQEG